MGFLVDSVVQNLLAGVTVDEGSVPGLGRPGGVERHPPAFLLRRTCWTESLAGHSPWDAKSQTLIEVGLSMHAQDELKSIPWGWKVCISDVTGCLPAARAANWSTVSRKERRKLFGVSWRRCLLLCLDVGFTFTLLIWSLTFLFTLRIFSPIIFWIVFSSLSFLFFFFKMLQSEYWTLLDSSIIFIEFSAKCPNSLSIFQLCFQTSSTSVSTLVFFSFLWVLSVTCGILVPQLRIEPCLLWKGRVPTIDPQGSP